MVLRKDQIEASLAEESKLIHDGILKEDSPLDDSKPFLALCEACRRGDLKVCQEMIMEGANINARDKFDYTPLILASLCGHYEVVQLLLESGALCERDTFQGERCLYNALNDRIRNLLLSYEYSKSTDPLQPFASHITSLLMRDCPQTSDILVTGAGGDFHLHKIVLSARSPYFAKKLANAPDTTVWKLPPAIPPQAFEIATRYIYLGEVPNDVGGGFGTGFSEEDILQGIDKISRHLEIRSLWDGILQGNDRRLARQRRNDEVEKGRDQFERWYSENVLKHKVTIDVSKAGDVKWNRDNGIFADVLLRADEPEDEHHVGDDGAVIEDQCEIVCNTSDSLSGIPIGPTVPPSRSRSREPQSRQCVLFPVHRAMIIRSEFFMIMFSSAFREAQDTEYLQIIPIACSPKVLEVVLTSLYTERLDCPLHLAIDVLFAADLLLMEKLKQKAAIIISTLGNGSVSHIPARLDTQESPSTEHDDLDIYDVIRAGWLTRVPRLEEFGARYLADRLESYIDDEEFADLVRESAQRIKGRQATDTIELLDDIRYYLSERFRLRFEDSGIDMMEEEVGQRSEDIDVDAVQKPPDDEGISVGTEEVAAENHMVVRTLDGKLAGDEQEGDAINYQILLGKIDALLDRLQLDA